MSKKSIYRVTMLIAGLIAVCAILLSPTFSQGKPEKKTAEKETVLIQAPADAIPGSAVKIDQPEIPLLSQIEEKEEKRSFPVIRTEQVTKYLKLLFRTLIAPNAP
jgi:hypothetical protein